MNDHNLDDLIIDHIEPKKSKAKSFLTILALLIVMLIAAIVLTKIILKDPNEHPLATEENHTVFISPELTLQTPAKQKRAEEVKPIKEETKPEKTADETSKTVVEESPLPVETVEEPTEPESETVTEAESTTVKEPVGKEESKPKTTLEIEASKTAEIPAPEFKEKEAPVKVETPVVTEPVEAATKPVTTTIKKVKPVVKPTTKPKPLTTTQIHYIQVGSFKKTPSKQFLGIIRRSGFRHLITQPNAKGLKRLLIGPYKSRQAAEAALPRVKDRINKRAFIIKQ